MSFGLVLFNMNRGINIFSDNSFGQKDRILVVVALPLRITDQNVLTQRQFSAVGRRTVCDRLSGFHMLSLVYDRTLVEAGRLVLTLIFKQFVPVECAVVLADNDMGTIDRFNDTVIFSNYAGAGVHGCLIFHTGRNDRCFGSQKRNGLALLVGTHQRSRGIIVLQEGNQRGSDREDLTGRNIHPIEVGRIFLDIILAVTALYLLINEMAGLIKRFVRLSDLIVFLFIGRNILDLIGHNGILAAVFADRMLNDAVRSFDKTIAVDTGVSCQRVDQTDVGTFRSLNGAHTSVMRMVNISNFESGTVTGQTSGAQGRQTSLVSHLCQRVVLIHKLRQLGTSEELFDGCRYRTDIDQLFDIDLVRVLRTHLFADDSLQAGQADTELVLQKLAYTADAAVAQMVDIIQTSDPFIQIQLIVDGGHDIFHGSAAGHQVIGALFKYIQKILSAKSLIDDLHQDRIISLFGDAAFLQVFIINVQIFMNINGKVAQNLDLNVVLHNIYVGDTCILDTVAHVAGQYLAGCSDDFTGIGICDIFCQRQSGDPSSEGKFFVILIAADMSKVIALIIKEHTEE